MKIMKIGIYSPWASGDAILSTMALKYKNLFWGGCHLVWFTIPKTAHSASEDMVSHQPLVDEVRLAEESFPELIKLRVGHRTNKEGHPLSVDRAVAGRMTDSFRSFKSMSDLDLCYFPAPWANCDKLSGYFALASEAVFSYPEKPHPCLEFTQDEDEKAMKFVASLPFKNSVMLETKCGSNQSNWDHSTSTEVMLACRWAIGDCNFIFASPGSSSAFAGPGVVDCSGFTIRQCIPIYNQCRLFVSTSSAVAIATCSWSASPSVRRVDYTNNPLITTKPIAMGETRWTSNQSELVNVIGESLK